MKKVILMMTLVLPLAMMAQTRPSPTKKPIPSEKERVFKPVNYMEMTLTEELVGKKGNKEVKTSYSFNSTNKRIDDMIAKSSSKFKSVVQALNYLNSLGWELISVSGDKYYFKNAKRGKPQVKRENPPVRR